MWNVSGNSLSMTEGDWGVKLPVTVSGATFAANDSLKIVIKNGETTLVEKEYTNITQNTVNLELTEAECASSCRKLCVQVGLVSGRCVHVQHHPHLHVQGGG